MDRLLEATFLAEREHFWFKGFRQFITPFIERGLAGVSAPRMLDCGCGTGSNLALLKRYGHASGFDLTSLGLQYARESGGYRVARASITHIPFRSETFDLVTSFDVLQCLNEAQETLAMAELARLLKPGGAVVLNVAALEMLRGSHSILAEEVRRYTPSMLRTRARARRLHGRTPHVHQRDALPADARHPHDPAPRRPRPRPRRRSAKSRCPPSRSTRSSPALLSLEARALRMVNMPIGSSLLVLARKR